MAVPGRVVIVDGDTLDIAGERIRLLGPDAPESHESRCEAELVVALKAKARLRALVDEAEGPLLLERHGRDRYGRTLARVYVRRVGRSVEVGDVLMTEGLAVQWRPGRAAWLVRAQHWCPSFTEGGE